MKLIIDIPDGMLEAIKDGYWSGSHKLELAIRNGIPYEEPKQGEWYYNYQNGWHCSICHETVKDMPTVMGKADFNFCPNCGVKMKHDT